MKTIATVLSNGWGIKTYLLTDFLAALDGRARLLALTPAADHLALREAVRGASVELEPLHLQPLGSVARHIQDIFVYAQFYRQPTFVTRLFMRYYPERIPWTSRAFRGAKKITARTLGIPLSIGLQTRFEQITFGLERETARLERLFRQHRVDLVFSTMPLIAHFERPALWAAMRCGIPTACLITSWDNLASKGRLPIRFDHYLTWSDLMKAALLRKYPFIRPGQITVVGPPQFDFYRRPDLEMEREPFLHSIGGDPARPLILWAAASTNQFPHEPQIIEAFYKALRETEGPAGPQVMVRAHPIGGLRRFEGLMTRCPDILFSETNPDDPTLLWKWTPSLDDMRLLVNSLRHAAVTINHCSTMTLDACAMDRPVINVAYDLESGSPMDRYVQACYRFDHYQCVLDLKAVRMAYTQDELLAHIRSYIQNPTLEAEGRRALLKLQCGNVDGSAARRVAEALVRACPGAAPLASMNGPVRESRAN